MTDKADLPLTAAHWGTYRVRSEGGRAVAMEGFERDPDPSPIGPGILDVQDGPLRITEPMVRKSWLEGGPGTATERRGADPFVAVSWDEVETLLSDELSRVREGFGNKAIYAGSYGWASAGRFHHAQSQLKRFLNCIGGFTNSVHTYSFAAAETVVPHILGDYRPFLNATTSWESIAGNTGLFVAFGGVPVKNGQIEAGGTGEHVQVAGLHKAYAAGCRFVNIGPLRSDMIDEVEAEWLAPRPNTDAAILIALSHTVLAEGLHDPAFLERYTAGFDTYAAYLRGDSDGVVKDAEWAAEISGLSAETIRGLARRMAGTRTMIAVAWSLTRQDHGEQALWAAITLAAMLGQIGLPGGGFGFGYAAENSIGGHYTLYAAGSLSQGQNPVPEFIPVARITELLENPGGVLDFDGRKLDLPETKIVWWAGGNPFHHHQDLPRMLRAWRKVDTVIANEWCWNALARHADIVLPCTTSLERVDIALASRDPYIIFMEQVAEVPGAARDDYAILRGLARRMGVEDVFTEGRDAEEWVEWIYAQTCERAKAAGVELPDYAALRAARYVYIDPPQEPVVLLREFRDDPQAHALKTPSGKIEIFSETVASFGYDDCPGHPVWRAPYEWLGEVVAYPLHLISNQPSNKLHSQLDHGSHSRAGKVNAREPVTLHPDDAAARGIAAGDVVRVHNGRGAAYGGAVLSDAVRPGVVQMSTGAWYDPEVPGDPDSACKHGNPNVLTRDKGTSRLGQGPTAHSCLVEVEKVEKAPAVTAFVPPEIVRREG